MTGGSLIEQGSVRKALSEQATQDGCSPAFCKSADPPAPASSPSYSHDWPSYVLALAGDPAGDCSNL